MKKLKLAMIIMGFTIVPYITEAQTMEDSIKPEREMPSAASRMLTLVPKDVDGLLWVDIEQTLQMPLLKEQLESENMGAQIKDIIAACTEQEIDFYKAFPAAMIFGSQKGENSGILLHTSIQEAKFHDIFNVQSEPIAEKYDGRSIYPFYGRDKNRNSAAVYLKPDIMLIAENIESLHLYRENMKSKANVTSRSELMQMQRKAPQNAVACLIFKVPQEMIANQDSSPQMGKNPLSMIRGGTLALEMLGSEKQDIRMLLRLQCKDQQSAMFGAMPINAFVTMGLSQMLQGNPQLAMQLNEKLQVKPVQKDILLDATITGTMINDIKSEIEKIRQSGGLQAGGRKHRHQNDQHPSLDAGTDSADEKSPSTLPPPLPPVE